MIPSRTDVMRWNTEVFTQGAEQAGAEGDELEEASTNCWRKMANFGWDYGWVSGAAAQAAERVTQELTDSANSVGSSLGGTTRMGVFQTRDGQALINEQRAVSGLVRTIESGELYVSEKWTVLVRSNVREARMARLFALAANGFQDQLNPKVVALSQADDGLSQLLRHQLNVLNIDLPDLPDGKTPKDVTESLYTEKGREDQRNELAAHMMGTVVGRTSVSGDGKTVTTLTMLDGGKQVYTNFHRGGVGDTMELFGYSGNRVATRVTQEDGSFVTTLFRPGKSNVVVRESKDGSATAEVDGVKFPVPNTKDVAQSVAGGGMAALEPYVASGMPFLSASQADRVKLGTQMAGPALTILGTAVNVADAKSSYDRCVAGVSGGFSLAADIGMMLVAPEAGGPLVAASRATGVGLVAGVVGNLVGQMVCER